MKSHFENNIKFIANSGGNIVRIWLHIDGSWSPKWDSQGYATGADTASLISDLSQLLDYAHSQNVYVLLCIWGTSTKLNHLFYDQKKLDTYLDKVLKPMAKALKDKPALIYDIVNEPEAGLLPGVSDSNPCFDTRALAGGGDWSKTHYKVRDMQRFINHHIDAIKSVAPNALCSIGDGQRTLTNIDSQSRNWFSDQCLRAAGGKQRGVAGKRLTFNIHNDLLTI